MKGVYIKIGFCGNWSSAARLSLLPSNIWSLCSMRVYYVSHISEKSVALLTKQHKTRVSVEYSHWLTIFLSANENIAVVVKTKQKWTKLYMGRLCLVRLG